MILTADGPHEKDFDSVEEFLRVFHLLGGLELRDARGTKMGRIQAVNTETNEVTFHMTIHGEKNAHYFNEDDSIVMATAVVKGLQLWIYRKDETCYQVDKNLYPLNKDEVVL